jgi:hypothetical protein
MEKQEINNKIDRQIPVNGQGLEWLRLGRIKGYCKGTDNEKIYEAIVNNRRQLKRIRYANNINPAAAIYGESQVGKSYLVDCILSSSRTGTLKVYDGEKRPYDFIYELNPIGEGKESTSLVSRFTTKQVWKNSKYPIKVIMLSPVDIVLTLCDSFYNDIKQPLKIEKDFKSEQISELLIQRKDELKNRYAGAPQSHHYIEEDDIYDIIEYFDASKGYLEKVGVYMQEILDSNYLKILSEVIGNIPVSNWSKAFSVLWNDNNAITEVFEKLINEYSKLNFRHEVFISMDAVLRKYGTLLAVDRIYELFDLSVIEGKETIQVRKAEVPDIVVLSGEQEITVRKSAFCALAAELTFQIDERLAEEKTFLKYIDLLDFPGARSRERFGEQDISKQNCSAMLLRGKVAYLFNKFTAQFLISNLLFCHHDTKSEVKTLSDLLKNWIKGSIGNTPEERSKIIEDSKISPLFLIGTKFNIDMKRSANYDNAQGDEKLQVMNEKWVKRYETTFKSVIDESPLNWFSEWITNGSRCEPFKNMYLLRSFEYSSQRELNIFTGYVRKNGQGGWELNTNEDDSLVGETGYSEGYEQYLPELKKSFINHSFVKEHFVNPSKSWDEAASINRDGSEWIIENLTIAAKNTCHSRQRKFERQLVELFAELDTNLRKFYHDDENVNLLVEAVKKAGKIQLEMDVAFGRDPYFFGRMMQRFQYSESVIYNYYLDKIGKIELIEQADISKYVAIRLANPNLKHTGDPQKKDEYREYNIEILKKTYKESDTEKLKQYFKDQEIDLEELFFGEEERIKSNSMILAEGLAEKWTTEVLTPEHFKDFIKDGFNETALTDLLDNIRNSFKQLEIVNLIAGRIRRYVDRYDKIDEIMEMIADISVEIINSFVNNIGFSYFGEEKLNEMKEANSQSNLDLVFNHDYLAFEPMETEDLTALFETLEQLDTLLNQRPLNVDALKNVPNFSQYKRWVDLMRISFVSVCTIPTYDVDANEKLGVIIQQQVSLTN